MSDLNIKDPVAEVPPIKRDMPLRESKWDAVLHKAVKVKANKNPSVPVEFDNYNSATSAARRIRDRAEALWDHDMIDSEFVVEQRRTEVYVTATK